MEHTFPVKIIDTNGSSDVPPEIAKLGRQRICCFTGHRPEGLPDMGDPSSPKMAALRDMTETYIRMLINSGHDVFITGMSRGFDLLAADLLTGIPDIAECTTLICAVPYGGQIHEMRTDAERELYRRAALSARYAVRMFGSYNKGCYMVRNRFMVNCSSVLIGYLARQDMMRSGSAQTYRMAQRAGLETVMIYEKDTERSLKG